MHSWLHRRFCLSAVAGSLGARYSPSRQLSCRCSFLSMVAISAPAAVVGAVRSGALLPAQAEKVASLSPRYWGGIPSAIERTVDGSSTAEDLGTPGKLDSVAIPGALTPEMGIGLAERQALVPGNAYGITVADSQRGLASYASAKHLLLRTTDYEDARDAVLAAPAVPDPPMAKRRFWGGGSRLAVFALTGCPTVPATRYADLDIGLLFGRYVMREWEFDHTLGSYTLLRRRGSGP